MRKAEDLVGAGLMLVSVALAVWVNALSAIPCCVVGIALIVAGQLRRRGDEADNSDTRIFRQLSSGTLVADTEANERRIELKNRLGVFHEAGERAYHDGDQQRAEAWATKVHAFIEENFGTGEAQLFLSDSGYVFFSGPGKVKNWVDGRLRRLANLIERADTLTRR